MDLNLSIVLSEKYYETLKKVSRDLFYKEYQKEYPFKDFAREKIPRTKLSDLHLATYTYHLWILYTVKLIEQPPLQDLPQIAVEYAKRYAEITIKPQEFLIFPSNHYPHVYTITKKLLAEPKLTLQDEYCIERCFSCCEDRNCRKGWNSDKPKCLRKCITKKCEI